MQKPPDTRSGWGGLNLGRLFLLFSQDGFEHLYVFESSGSGRGMSAGFSSRTAFTDSLLYRGAHVV
ncbi:hypothetical protein SAMN05442782_7091 [Streptomyces sp. OK228]|nr:hypothetical protein SAMN05442782_7091 [Streptomyces sp. OK228]